MTKRDTFLTRSEFMQLLYAACCPSRPGSDPAAAINIALPPPALIAPRKLYTGKQVISWFSTRLNLGVAELPFVLSNAAISISGVFFDVAKPIPWCVD